MRSVQLIKGMKWWKAALGFTAGVALLSSCDDDPLVEPDTQEEECTGSYCKLEKNEDDFLNLPMALLNTKDNPQTF